MELIGVLYLTLKGYKILKRRYKTFVGEIDIVAKKGNTFIFVEVKYRPTYERALYAINEFQQRRLLRTAESFMVKKSGFCRFDCLLFSPWRIPMHLKNIIQKEWVPVLVISSFLLSGCVPVAIFGAGTAVVTSAAEERGVKGVASDTEIHTYYGLTIILNF